MSSLAFSWNWCVIVALQTKIFQNYGQEEHYIWLDANSVSYLACEGGREGQEGLGWQIRKHRFACRRVIDNPAN